MQGTCNIIHDALANLGCPENLECPWESLKQYRALGVDRFDL